MSGRLALSAGGWACEVAPGMGGSILSLSLDGAPILRPTSEAAITAGEVRASACYPLIPYANRVGQARFAFAGIEHRLALNFPHSPHSLHGVGWLRAWRVVEADEAACTLALEHRAPGSDGAGNEGAGNEAGDWPFAFDARQRFALDPEGLTVSLELTNASHEAAPAGFGLHPFFVRRPGEVLTFAARGAWTNGPDMLPAERVCGGGWDHAAGQAVGGAALDNDFFGWDGQARMTAPDKPTVRLTAGPPFAMLRVFAPEGADFLAVEPVTHMADAINRPDEADGAMRVLAPGETLRGQARFSVEQAR